MWKGIFSLINSNSIANDFNLTKNYQSGFCGLLHNLMTLPNYTILNNETKINLEITNKDSHFTFIINWKATKIKGSFIETIYNEIVIQKYYQNNYINWRNFCFDGFLNIVNLVENFKFTIDKEKNIEIQFELFLNKIYDGESYEILDNNFIIDLSNKSTKEVYYYGLDFFGSDYKKCIEVLKTILDKFPYAGIIIGLAYKGLEKPELSNQYLKKFYKNFDELIYFDDEYTALIIESIATNNLNLGKAPKKTMKLLFKVLSLNQNHTALIKLSYLILSKNKKKLKNFALENVTIATPFNLLDDDKFTQSAGFHIICCVLLWNDKFGEAEKYHHYFLIENTKFTSKHISLIEQYLLLALAKNNIEFIGNLILDFPYLMKIYGSYFDAWYFINGNLANKTETNAIIYNSRLINAVKKEYCD